MTNHDILNEVLGRLSDPDFSEEEQNEFLRHLALSGTAMIEITVVDGTPTFRLAPQREWAAEQEDQEDGQ